MKTHTRVAASLLALLCLSCGGTERTRSTFPLVVSKESGALVTDSGWTVTLTSATASLTSARFFSGEVPAISRRWSPLDLLISTAWAHPGHYVPGEALGELLTPVEVDLLAGDTPWGTVSAVTGRYGSMQLTLGSAGLRLAGMATKDMQTVAFDTQGFAPAAPIEAIAFAHDMDASAGQVRLAFDLKATVSRMDFAQVGTGANPLDPASPCFNGFGRGVQDSSAYHATWEVEQ
ncbi:MAG: hypothetical protein AB1938_03655 [Myxococcota bacterium]